MVKSKHLKMVEDALKIEELRHVLQNIAHDDSKEIEDYSEKEILHEADYVLGMFAAGSGWTQRESLEGDHGPEEKKWAQKQVRQLKAFIKKYRSL